MGYFWPASDKFESWKKIHTFDGVMTNCHIFESVKNHINAYISHPIRDRNAKTYYDMDVYDRKMVINTNLEYADSSLNYLVIIMVQNFLKF